MGSAERATAAAVCAPASSIALTPARLPASDAVSPLRFLLTLQLSAAGTAAPSRRLTHHWALCSCCSKWWAGVDRFDPLLTELRLIGRLYAPTVIFDIRPL